MAAKIVPHMKLATIAAAMAYLASAISGQALASPCLTKEYAQIKDEASQSEKARDQLVLQYCANRMYARGSTTPAKDATQCLGEADKILTALRASGDAARADGADKKCEEFRHK